MNRCKSFTLVLRSLVVTLPTVMHEILPWAGYLLGKPLQYATLTPAVHVCCSAKAKHSFHHFMDSLLLSTKWWNNCQLSGSFFSSNELSMEICTASNAGTRVRMHIDHRPICKTWNRRMEGRTDRCADELWLGSIMGARMEMLEVIFLLQMLSETSQMLSKTSVDEVFMHHFEIMLSASGGFAPKPHRGAAPRPCRGTPVL